jgi:hypothetical protein
MLFLRVSQPLSLKLLIILAILVALIFPTQQLAAQVLPPRGLIPVAVSGEPFGVLSVEVPLPPDWIGGEPRVLVSDNDGRLFYPVVSIQSMELATGDDAPNILRIGRPGGIIDRVRNAIKSTETKQVPVALQITALFRGNRPITIDVRGDVNQQITFAVNQVRAATHNELLDRWWTAYKQQATSVIQAENTPPLVPLYLTDMLARRLNQQPLQLDSVRTQSSNQPLETLQLLTAIEPLREQVLHDVITRPIPIGAEQPVPLEPNWQDNQLPPLPSDPSIEPIAARIPPECFYLRFGSFGNYVWFQELSERFGGDLSQAVFLRGFDYEGTSRIERMLATKLTSVAKLFGDNLVEDMALFGSDLYIKEGASLAVVLQSVKPEFLKRAIDSDRAAVLSQQADARLQQIEIAGIPVSFLSTPDNRIHSYFCSHDNYMVISTSKHLITRFLEVANSRNSLASTPSFRWARLWMPESNNYSVFGYLSPDFFHRLVSPQYQIELNRRLQAVAHLELAEVAAVAQSAEQLADSDSIDALKANGMLPDWFDERPDGSQVLRLGDRWVDAIRGGRGSFLPIADVNLTGVSPVEAQQYAQLADYYQNKWRRMDPLLLGIRRFQGQPANAESVAFEAHLAPFEPGKYGWITQQLANPSPLQIKQPADDAVSLQLHLRGELPDESYFLFGGLKDMLPPEPEEVQGLIKTLRALKAAPAYIGAWPKPGLIEQLPLGLGKALARPDLAGFSRMIGGLWRWQNEQWSLLSFDRSILEGAIGHLATVEGTEQSQVRLNVTNLDGTQLAQWINGQWWQRGWRASHANALLLDSIQQQLKVPADQCLAMANRLLDVRVQCPLGGEYVLPDNGLGLWESSAWQQSQFGASGKPLPPVTYQAPWINWFRGGRVEATQQPAALSLVGLVQLQLPPLRSDLAEPTAESGLPKLDFDLFTLPLKMFAQGLDNGGKDSKNPTQSGRQSF